MRDSKPVIAQLRTAIAALESRQPLEAGPESDWNPGSGFTSTSDRNAVDALALLHPPRGLLQEVFADERRAGGTALGFSLGLARTLVSRSRPAVLYLELTAEAQESGLPYGPGLASFGFDPAALVLGRIATIAELLWAMEEAIACPAVAAVIAEIPGAPAVLDFTVSRRLALRAATTRTSVIVLRYGTGREASAARLRWRVAPALSGTLADDPVAPGPPRFAATVEKCRLGAAAQALEGKSFVFDWVNHGFVIAEGDPARRVDGAGAAAPRVEPAAFSNRLSQAG